MNKRIGMWKRLIHSNIGAVTLNIALAYLVWMLSRVAFFAENWSTFAPYMSWSLFKSGLHGALVFDTSALLYVNSLYIVLMLLPLHLKERSGFHKALKLELAHPVGPYGSQRHGPSGIPRCDIISFCGVNE